MKPSLNSLYGKFAEGVSARCFAEGKETIVAALLKMLQHEEDKRLAVGLARRAVHNAALRQIDAEWERIAQGVSVNVMMCDELIDVVRRPLTHTVIYGKERYALNVSSFYVGPSPIYSITIPYTDTTKPLPARPTGGSRPGAHVPRNEG